jgi:hypothetical protein
LHVSAVIVNNDRKSAVDAHVDLIRVQRINKPNDHGQPHIDGLPRRLVSDKANEFQTIAPEREQAFALCAKHEKLERDAVLVLAPGSKGDPLAVLPPGSYFLHVVASAHDTPPTRATFKVDISHLGMGYRLCTPEEVAAPETIPTIRAHTSIVALLDHDDFKKYDGCRRFELYEAACLWAGERPALPLSPTSERHFRELEAAVQNDQLAVLRDLNEALADAYDLVVHGKKTKANPHWKVDREDLLARANALGEKPPFLFPRERV